MAIVNELVTKFSYQGSTAPVNDYTKSLSGAFDMLTKVTAIAGVATAGFGAMIIKSAEHADAISDLSQRTGIATDSLQRLGYIAQLNGSSFESMNSSLEGLNRQIGLAVNGEKMQADTFKELGISVKDSAGNVKSADVVFLEMNQRMQALGYGTQQVAGVLRKLRLDPTMAQTLNLSAEEMAKFAKEADDAGILTQQQIDNASEFEDSLDRMKVRLMAVGNQFMLNLAPALVGFMNKTGDAINYIKGFIAGLVHVAKSLYTALESTIGFKTGLVILGGILAWFYRGALLNLIMGFRALAVAILTNPMTWIIGAIVVLALVVDDLVSAFTGGESVIGDFFAQFDIDIVNTLIDGFNILMRMLAPIGLAFTGLGLVIAGVAKTTAQFFNMLGAGIDTKGLDAMTAKLTSQAKSMESIASGDTQAVANRQAYVASAPKPQTVANSNTNNQVNVTVNGATDPQKTADMTAKAVARETRAVATQRGNGGR